MNTQTTFAEPAMDEEAEGREVPNAKIETLMQVSEAEVNRQILTARAYPRNTTGFRQALQELVCYDEPTALSCLYALKKGGSPVQGPSIRFAEAAFQTWGNARCGSRVIDIGEEWITAQGFFWDLEKNTGLAFEVIRRLTDKNGKRYSEDVIMSTGNAASSIALRNAILKGIPKTAWNPIYLRCRQVSVGAGESISEKRDNMLKAFAPLNVDKAQILGLLGVKGMDDVTIDHMIFLGGIRNAIMEGETTAEDAFAVENMSHPDQVQPRQPKRSDFAREDKKPQEKQAQTVAKEAQQQTTKQEPAREQQTNLPLSVADKAALQEEDRKGWIKDIYAELAGLKRIRDVPDICQRGIEAGVFSAEEEAKWQSDCQAKSDAIMDAAKANRGSHK